MSGLLALLDDVAAIAKVAAASVDDIATAAGQAGAKAAGVVIDDAAVTPAYVQGFSAKRELPIIWRIAIGSLRNKLVLLLPVALLLSNLLPELITPLLMLGGVYLCFEGAEKILHKIWPKADAVVEQDFDVKDPAHLEEEKVAGAIKTDFILSAEIMTIALAAIPDGSLWIEAATLAIVGAAITVLVYGAVALIVKMDDIGLFLARRGRLGLTRRFGRGLVNVMPHLLVILSTVGTAAMLWVGGQILLHGFEHFGWGGLLHWVEVTAEAVAAALPEAAHGGVAWLGTAALSGVFGLGVGLLAIPLATRIVAPVLGLFGGKKKSAH